MAKETFWKVMASMIFAFCIVSVGCCVTGAIPEWNQELAGNIASVLVWVGFIFGALGMEGECGRR